MGLDWSSILTNTGLVYRLHMPKFMACKAHRWLRRVSHQRLTHLYIT
jgi:hypothetical protein